MSTFRLKPGAAEWREVEGEVVVLDLVDSLYLGVNRAGAILWTLLATGSDVPTMTQELKSRFELDEGMAMEHVERFVEVLEARGLIERS